MAESSAKRRRVDDGGGEVPPLLDESGDFSRAVYAALRDCDKDMLQRITDRYTVDAQNRHGGTLLMTAASMGNVASVPFLIERGAAVNIQDDFKETVLHFACDSNEDVSIKVFEEMLLLLLRAGADPSVKNKDGETLRDLCEIH